MAKFTKMGPEDFKHMTWDAGIILDKFTPETGEFDPADIRFATTGDNSFSATRDLTDMGADINNCPENTMQLQKAQPWQANMSGTAVTVTAEDLKMFLANADIEEISTVLKKIVPRTDLLITDFHDKWLVFNYSELNGEKNGGFCAIHIMNALSADGFSGTLIESLVTALVQNAPMMAQGAVQLITQLAVSIGQALPYLIPAAVQAVLTFLEGLTSPESLNSLINGALVLIQGLVVGFFRALPYIRESAGDIIANFITGISGHGPEVAELGFQILGELIKGMIEGLIQLPAALAKIGSAMLEGIKNSIGNIWDWITGKNKDSLDTIETDIDSTWGRTQDSTQKAWGGMQTQVGSSMSGMVGTTSAGMTDIGQSFTSGWSLSSLSTQQNLSGMEGQVDSSMSNMVGLTTTGTGNIVTAFDEGWYNANTSTELGLEGIVGTTDTMSNQAVTAVDTNFGKMEGTVVDNLNRAKTAAGQVDFTPIGSNAVDGMSEGARSKAQELADTMANAALSAFNAAKAALQINSPSKRGEWLWQMVMEGSVIGVNKNAYKLENAMEAASENALEAFQVSDSGFNFGFTNPAPIDFSSYAEYYKPYESSGKTRNNSGTGDTIVNIYSPKAVDAVEAAREWKKTTQQLAMGF